ncbi:glycosyltransferase [Flavobacterium sp.]|uniref:glycosyltransferase n=1 Tax=Flavobacterium sp. TaxID=239 RepID=UPI002B4B8FF1|nr:glycosyltransferase [Flavobacterium sp.]HLP63164.1 glycosyltransferase [Flavobacterium sp.]
MNQNQARYKICLITVTLSDGGAERSAATLSHFFGHHNCEVHNVVFAGEIVYDYSGELLHLGKLKDKNNSLFTRYQRFKTLKSYLKKHQFDYIIDFRVKRFYLQEFILNNWIYGSFIQTIHSRKLDSYLPKNKLLAQLLYRNCDKMIVVSKSIEAEIQRNYSFKNTLQIYNPIDVAQVNVLAEEKEAIDFNYILAAGSMHKNVKQFDHLIESYSNSILPNNNIKLIILGDGKMKESWMQLSKDLNQEHNVQFLGSVSNPFPYYKKALFTVLTSKYEGMPMVLLESLSCGTPVVAYDCDSGPSEIIIDKHNGLLIDNQNKKAMTQGLNAMIENKDLYLQCKSNAQSSIASFDVETIGNQWLQLLKK